MSKKDMSSVKNEGEENTRGKNSNTGLGQSSGKEATEHENANNKTAQASDDQKEKKEKSKEHGSHTHMSFPQLQ